MSGRRYIQLCAAWGLLSKSVTIGALELDLHGKAFRESLPHAWSIPPCGEPLGPLETTAMVSLSQPLLLPRSASIALNTWPYVPFPSWLPLIYLTREFSPVVWILVRRRDAIVVGASSSVRAKREFSTWFSCSISPAWTFCVRPLSLPTCQSNRNWMRLHLDPPNPSIVLTSGVTTTRRSRPISKGIAFGPDIWVDWLLERSKSITTPSLGSATSKVHWRRDIRESRIIMSVLLRPMVARVEWADDWMWNPMSRPRSLVLGLRDTRCWLSGSSTIRFARSVNGSKVKIAAGWKPERGIFSTAKCMEWLEDNALGWASLSIYHAEPHGRERFGNKQRLYRSMMQAITPRLKR